MFRRQQEPQITCIDSLATLQAGGDAVRQASLVNLSGEDVTDEAVANFALCGGLDMVILGRTSLRGPGLRFLQGRRIQVICMQEFAFAEGIWPELAKLQAEGLQLNEGRISTENFSELAAMPNLKRIGIGLTPIGRPELAAIARLPHLTQLGLIRTGVCDADLEELACMPNLTLARLAFEQITPVGLAHLAVLPHLRELDLTGLPECGDALLGFANLTWLQISDMTVSQSVVDELNRRDGLEFRCINCEIVD